MRYPPALGGLALGAVVVVTGCHTGRAPYDLSLAHHRTGRPAPARPFRQDTPMPHAVPSAVRIAPPARRDAWPRARPTRRDAWPPAPPALRGLPHLRHGDWLPAPPVHACATVRLGHGTSMQCVQRQDEVITRSRSRAIGDADSWPDTDRDDD